MRETVRKLILVYKEVKYFILRILIGIGNIPITLWILSMVTFLIVFDRPIPEWLIEKTKEVIKKKEVMPEPYEMV